MRRFLLIVTIMFVASASSAQEYSKLWGKDGELWSPESRLPDFSFAGYHFGEDPLPHVEVAANVREFGAVGDGKHDDTDAFKKAIEATEAGAIRVPEGRWLLSDILWIKKPNIVLRGAGPDKTVLVFNTTLEAVRPNMGATTGGRPTSNYSWSGGFVWVKGSYGEQHIAAITTEVARGSRTLVVKDASKIAAGQRVMIQAKDTHEKSLLQHLYSGDAGDTAKVTKPVTAKMVSRVAAVDGNRVTLERPLRFDLRKEWSPTLRSFNPSVSEAGIEELSFEFPNTPYQGHFTELGYNAIAINGASDCWVRNVQIQNSDSGVYVSGMFCTVEGLIIDSDRKQEKGATGHHGILMGADCLVRDFDFRTHFIHDITLSSLNAGNVVKNGRGTNLSLDHHKKAPYENLFCNLDLGKGSEMWRCGGGASLGKHCGARGTFWNIRAEQAQEWPRDDFGPDSMNLIGVQTQAESMTDPEGRWLEAILPAQLEPSDLHAAQLARRLSR